MNASAAKILGIILVALLVLMIAWPIKFVLFAPVGIINGLFNGFHGSHFTHSDWWPWIGFAGFVALAALLFWIAVVVWVYRDAESRGMNGVLWVLVVFFVHLIGLLIYFLVRSEHPRKSPQAGPAPGPACPNCGKPVERDHTYCAACGDRIQPKCPKCGRDIQPGWAVCPYCGEKL
jgi:hypothetical protein